MEDINKSNTDDVKSTDEYKFLYQMIEMIEDELSMRKWSDTILPAINS